MPKFQDLIAKAPTLTDENGNGSNMNSKLNSNIVNKNNYNKSKNIGNNTLVIGSYKIEHTKMIDSKVEKLENKFRNIID